MPRPRCERCQRPLDHCLCSLIPALGSRTRVILLQHPSESAHALNTARLAALGLSNAELRVGRYSTTCQRCWQPLGTARRCCSRALKRSPWLPMAQWTSNPCC